jgi:thiol-disulfide isomerase/thioredoxin
VRGRVVRLLLAAVVVVVAVGIAVWPRGHGNASTAAPRPPANLTAARHRADLASCAAAGPAKALAGVRVTCLANGTSVDLGSLVAGRPTLVNVWASWCQPCQRELPALDAYAAQPGAIRVIGVQVQSGQQDGLQLLTSVGVHHMPMVIDTAGTAAKALHLPVGLPVSYLVHPDGSATVITSPSRVLDTVAQVKQAVATYLGAG